MGKRPSPPKGYRTNYICERCSESSLDPSKFVNCEICHFNYHKGCKDGHICIDGKKYKDPNKTPK